MKRFYVSAEITRSQNQGHPFVSSQRPLRTRVLFIVFVYCLLIVLGERYQCLLIMDIENIYSIIDTQQQQ